MSRSLRSAGVMSIAVFMSRILGLVREQVFAYSFGAGHMTDAFAVAFRIPNVLRDLFAEGAMSASLVPLFTKVRTQEGEARAWQVAGRIFIALFCGVGVLAVLGMLVAPQLVELYAHGFHAVPGKFELTVRMTRIMFPFFPCVAVAAAFMAVLNARGVFFMPAFASALFNVTSILVGLWVSMFFPVYPIEGMAFGIVFGGCVQALCQVPYLLRGGYRKPFFSLRGLWGDTAVHAMLRSMVPGMVGLAATQSSILINTVLASRLMPGSISWLSYAFRLIQFPIGVFGVSLAQASVPSIAEAAVLRDFERFRQELEQGLNRLWVVNCQAAAGLCFLGGPIIRFLFEHGKFHASDTAATAHVLGTYALGLPAYAAMKLLVPSCYALGFMRATVIASGISFMVTLVWNGSSLFLTDATAASLAAGTVMGAYVNVFYLMRILPRVRIDWLRPFALSCLVGGGAFLLDAWVDLGPSLLMQAGKLFGIIAFSVLFFLFGAFMLRIAEVRGIMDFFFKKLKKKLRSKGASGRL